MCFFKLKMLFSGLKPSKVFVPVRGTDIKTMTFKG